MRFSRRDDYEIVTRIAGPIHHYLGLRLIDDPSARPSEPPIEDLSPPAEHEPVGSPPEVSILLAEVRDGLNAANKRLGTRYKVGGIRYCSSDFYVKDVYKTLADSLVEHVARRDHPASHLVDCPIPPRRLQGDPPLDDESLDQIAEGSFLEYDAHEAADGKEVGR